MKPAKQMKPALPSTVRFETECVQCPGDGVVRAKRPGVDWPVPCPCRAQRCITSNQLGRMLDEDPGTIVRVAHLRTKPETALRVLEKLVARFSL